MALKALLAAATTMAVSIGFLLPVSLHGHALTRSQFEITEIGHR